MSLTRTLTVRAGKFYLPFGTFNGKASSRMAKQNFRQALLGFGHDGIALPSGIGVEL